MSYSTQFPYCAVLIKDDTGTNRTNLAGTSPFPLEVMAVEIKRSAKDKTSTFSLNLSNSYTSGTYGPVGKYITYFKNLNNSVDIYLGTGSPGNHVLTGTINKWSKVTENGLCYIKFDGKDATAELMNKIVPIRRYEASDNRDYAACMRDLCNYANIGISCGGLLSPTTEAPNIGKLINSNKTFAGVNFYDAIKQLADEIGYYFWIDADKKLHIQKKGEGGNVITVSSNEINSKANEVVDIDTTKNSIWIYAGRIPANDVTILNESHTYTEGVSNMMFCYHFYIYEINDVTGTVSSAPVTFTPGVDYEQYQTYGIRWLDGGDKPDTGTAVLIDYKYTEMGRPVIYHAKDPAIINNYKAEKVQWIRKPEIATKAVGATTQEKYTNAYNEAKAYADGLITQTKLPKEALNMTLERLELAEPNDKVNLNIPEFNIINSEYLVKDVDYTYQAGRPITTTLTLEKITGVEI